QPECDLLPHPGGIGRREAQHGDEVGALVDRVGYSPAEAAAGGKIMRVVPHRHIKAFQGLAYLLNYRIILTRVRKKDPHATTARVLSHVPFRRQLAMLFCKRLYSCMLRSSKRRYRTFVQDYRRDHLAEQPKDGPSEKSKPVERRKYV